MIRRVEAEVQHETTGKHVDLWRLLLHTHADTHTLVRSFWSIINGISAVKTYKHSRSLPSAHAPHVFREFPFDRQVT